MSTKEQLTQAVTDAKVALAAAEAALEGFDMLPENNVFASLDEAEGKLEDKMRGWARKDCEGSYNCGSDKYTCGFIVDGKEYVGTLKCEYNRHDKTYYYVEEAQFSYAAV